MKKKNLRENTIENNNVQVTGDSPGSMNSLKIHTPGGSPLDTKNVQLPYQIQNFKQKFSQLLELTMTLTNELDNSIQNPSVKKSQKSGLKRARQEMDSINQKIIELPKFLELFEVDNW